MSDESIPPKKGVLGFQSLSLALIVVWGLVILCLIVVGIFIYKRNFSSNTSSTSVNEQLPSSDESASQTLPLDICTDDTVYTSIDEALEKSSPEKVCTLNLAGQELSELPKEVLTFTNLHTIGLGRNNFTAIPEELGSLTKLENIGLSVNNITELPEDPAFLSGVKIIDLSENPINESDLEAFKKALPNTEVRYLEKMPAFIQPKE